MDLPKSAAAFAAAGQGDGWSRHPDRRLSGVPCSQQMEDEPKDAIDRMLFGYDEDLRSSLYQMGAA